MALNQLYIDKLLDDLVLQQTVMDSLDDDEVSDVEEKRQEAKKELERLRAELREAKQKKQATNRKEPQYVSERAQQDQAVSGPSSVREKGNQRASMATPVRQGQGSWSSPGSHSLPTRKREFDHANLDTLPEFSKSRRTTPIPHGQGSAFNPSSERAGLGSVSDPVFIDLTGDDDDLVTQHMAAQKRYEQMREQERMDREFASQLSSYDAVATGSNLAPQNNAFAKLMGSQPFEGLDMDMMNNLGGPISLIQTPEPSPTMNMPGAYDTSWDDALIPPPIPLHTLTQDQMINGAGNASAPSLMSSQSLSGYVDPIFGSLPLVNGQWTSTLGAQVDPTYVGYPAGQSYDNTSTNLTLSTNSASGTSGPSRMRPNSMQFPSSSNRSGGFSSVADIINTTSMFDYASGTDADGNPLSDRLTNFLQDAYHDPRMTEKDLDNLLQNIRPDMDIPESNRDGTPAGLNRPLYPHQELALTWMKKMEAGTNHGGILADDMGLGKTISTLALMLSRPGARRSKTNLIVGPVALIRQWEEEIKTKTRATHRLSVFVYHGKKATTDDLLKYDVVLTTYGTVAQELKRLDQYYKDNETRNIDDTGDRTLALKCPLLHPYKAKFHRVILDEAQCIKNKSTQTAKACHLLKATYRWCLTGTPMMNGVLELYSLLNFLRIKPYSDWDQFRQSFGVLFGRNGDAKSIAMKRLRALLKAIMLRRKKNSQLDGKPILRLPEKTETIVYAELTPEERDFYDQLEKKSQVQFSKYLRAGSIGKNYSNILVLLLRLRQACCHPHLNLDVDDVSTVTDDEKLELVKKLDKAIVERIKAIEAFECPICYDAVQSPSFFIPCGHDSCSECLCKLAENAATMNLHEGNESSRAKCPVCRGVFEPSKCFTYEAFQKVHMPERFVKPEPADEFSDDEEGTESEEDFDSDADERGNLKGFVIPDGFDDKTDDSQKGEASRKAKKKNKGKKKAMEVKPSMLKTLRKEASKNHEAFKKYMRYLRKTWLPAAKVTECMNLLKQIQETGEKTIIFSQWTLLLDLLEVAMWHDKFPHPPVRYDGSMSATLRNTAAKRFRDKPDVKVMLVSLRAGNAGLNLTAASRVIIMDPFWNPYIEMQAVDRAYRIGQQKEVKVYRILTKLTVEDRIVALQDKKKEIVEAALDEAESAKIGRLGVSELKFLFNAQ